MSFLDKVKAGLKKATDRVTGGYATLEVEVPPGVVCGAPFTARLRLTASADLKVLRLRLRVEEFEHVEFTDFSERTDEEGKVWQQRATGRFYAERCLQEFTLAHELSLFAGENWEGTQEITIPSTRRPTFEGRWFRHTFKLEAVAEIPWGVDLEEREVFAVAGPGWEREVAGLRAHGEPVRLSDPPSSMPVLLRCRESVQAEIAVRPREGPEEGDWTSLPSRWVIDIREAVLPELPEYCGPAFDGPHCRHERFLVVDGSEHPLEPGE